MPSPPAFATARSTRSASSPPAPLSIRIGRGNRRSSLCFERIGNALGWIFADAEADGGGEFGRIEPGGNVRAGFGNAECLRRPAAGQRGQRERRAVGPVSPAFEEIVIFLLANRKQAELRQAGVGIDDDAVRQTHRFAQLRPNRQTIIDGPAAAIGDRKMPQARIGREQLPAFLRTGEPDRRVGKALFRGVENDAGDGDVGAQGDTRKDENVFNGIGIAIQNPRPANALVARQQVLGMQAGMRRAITCGKQLGVNAAQTQARTDPPAAPPRCGTARDRHRSAINSSSKCSGQGRAFQAMRQQILREQLSRDIFQPAAPASCAWPPARPWDR